MLLLLFHLSNDLYAIDSAQVVEIIPLVILRKLYHAPEYVAGLFNYRGKIVPVIDLCHLIQGYPCHLCLSTRIIMVNYPRENNTMQYLGLMAEQVTDTLNKPETELIKPDFQSEQTAYLGEVIMDEQRMIQRIRVESLLPNSHSSWLLLENQL